MTTVPALLAQLATGTPGLLLAVVVVLAATFLVALAIAVRGTPPEERAAVLRAFAQTLPVRRR
ncbi:hypothetical protein GCM10010260_82670 [Streptomyces filipinensis]|uniref:Uncharacterized protein n=1 Tax=Streptomyces filipinensis TaxID=66887 RepID=A0A918IKC9_9ACTN|nr:hypothetical protein [Streptomyces filipinensis]GGV29578.1 hypothetical protein GCM10010260_82670 [Streptomyces filipinensis]